MLQFNEEELFQLYVSDCGPHKTPFAVENNIRSFIYLRLNKQHKLCRAITATNIYPSYSICKGDCISFTFYTLVWCGWDLNPRPPTPKADALPT